MKIFVNSLTMLRVLATILLPIVWVYLDPISILIFVVAILSTDFFDGLLARTFKVQTLFGALLDQAADKAFGIIILLIIGRYEPLFYLVAIMEIVIALVNIGGGVKGATTNSSFLGKTKMWVMGLATTCALISIFDKQLYLTIDIQSIKDLLLKFMENKESIVFGFAFLTVGSQIMVALDYAKHIKGEVKDNKKKIVYNFKNEKELKKVLFDTEYYLKNKDLPVSKHLLK